MAAPSMLLIALSISPDIMGFVLEGLFPCSQGGRETSLSEVKRKKEKERFLLSSPEFLP